MSETTWVPMEISKNGMPNSYWVNSQSVEGQFYQVILIGEVWKCTCLDYIKRKLPCKHIGHVLDHRTKYEEEEGAEPALPRDTSSPSNGTTPSSISRWVKEIHGKSFVLYEGLLAMAHEQGLVRLHAKFISVDEKLALAFAFAKFKDGRKFFECGDATPSNVGAQVKAHFARIALTRAKARCLRDALNIGI